jgi:hypothetical protein
MQNTVYCCVLKSALRRCTLPCHPKTAPQSCNGGSIGKDTTPTIACRVLHKLESGASVPDTQKLCFAAKRPAAAQATCGTMPEPWHLMLMRCVLAE